MKTKITSKELKRRFDKIISIGYCSAQKLLRNHSPIWYNCGVYGWNYDAYLIEGVCIVTGYRSTPTSTVKFNYELLRQFESEGNKAIKDVLNLILEVKKEC